MHGWLIYDSAGAQKNQWFIQRLIALAAARGLRLQLKLDDGGLFEGALPSFAIVRTIRPALNAELERAGVRVFNNAQTARIACDKWETYRACKAWGVPVLPTATQWSEEIGYPCIVKTADGHGGAEVFMASTRAEYEKLVARLNGRRYVVQKQNAALGEDMRLYVIGGEIVAGVLRRSQGDFRSNFSLGGKVELREADERQRSIVKTLYERLKFDFVGVDFFPDGNGGWLLNELEDSAGARMLYSLSDVDIAERFVNYVAQTLN